MGIKKWILIIGLRIRSLERQVFIPRGANKLQRSISISYSHSGTGSLKCRKFNLLRSRIAPEDPDKAQGRLKSKFRSRNLSQQQILTN